MRPSLALLLLAACNPDAGLKVYNTPPEVTFSSPANGSSFAEGVAVLLGASVHDAQEGVDELSLTWNVDDGSELDGQQVISGDTVTFLATGLSGGDHVITLLAVDEQSASGEDSVTVHVVPDEVPVVAFVAPLEGERVAAEDRLRVEISVSDTDEADLSALTLAWTGDGDLSGAPTSPDSAGLAAFYLDGLSEGPRSLEVTVTDSLGASASTLVGFEAVLADADLDGHRSLDWEGDDCDDDDAAVHPDADELCNGVDDDCDGEIDEDAAADAGTWYADADADGYGDPDVTTNACEEPDGYTSDASDCDDGDAAVLPGGVETCDGADQDCDGDTDEDDAADASTWYADTDGDGYGDPDASAPACDQPAAYVADATDCDDADADASPAGTEVCDGDDDDCDGTVDEDDATDAPTWYTDADGDGHGGPATTRACTQPAGAYATAEDCDDTDADASPVATEYCDGEDDDCDGVIDEDDAADAPTWYGDGDADGYGDATVTTIACDAPAGYAASATDCDDGEPAIHPGATEADCADPVDYNCDGSIAYDDVDGDGWAACEECDDRQAAVNPDATEQCNDVDDDCDGDTDEDDAADAATWYADADGDDFGDAGAPAVACDAPFGHVADATDCDDLDASDNPAAAEVCDGDDDDCDGVADEDDATDVATWYADADADGFGDAAVTDVDCDQPAGFVADRIDCDDGDDGVSPADAELCDGEDDDCDGVVDEDDAVDAATWYADADSDGFGDAAVAAVACSAPAGHVADATDCDDAASAVNPAATEVCDGEDDDCDGTTDEDDAADALTWYRDADTDGYGDAGATHDACSAPSGYVADRDDCDDGDATEHPGASEMCDGDDDDCDGAADEDDATDVATWYADADADGYGDVAVTDVECDQPAGFVADRTDCDDGDNDVSPAAAETCDGEDDDCDGVIDEDDAVDAATWYADADSDGFGDAAVAAVACSAPAGHVADATDCDDAASAVNPAATEVCDGEDDDCDGTTDEDDAADASTWYADADGDDFGDAGAPVVACDAPFGHVADATDCDDRDASENPAAAEVCDGDDDDCDGATDEDDATDVSTWYRDADSDGYGDPARADLECDQPAGYVADASDCDDADAGVSPADTETCDGEDDDCDGVIDEDDASGAPTWYRDADADGYGDAATPDVACSAPSGYVASATDCDDGDAGVSPADAETCDGEDDDCDGVIDEDDATDAHTWYADADSDGHGDPYATTESCTVPSGYVALADDCDDTDASTSPSATETCDGADDDCDGTVDEDDAADADTWYLDGDGDGVGDASASRAACDQPAGYVVEIDDCDDSDADVSPYADEVCNGDDDDCDGTIDEDSAVDAPTWYADADGDGYGTASSPDVACSAPAGHVSNDDDCDNASASISPGATEVCDASDTDEDCDGLADDADPSAAAASRSTFYADADGDGHAGATTSLRCDATSAWLATSTDCDDGAASVNPDETEVCDASDTDEDCDGVADDEGAGGCTSFYVDSDGDGYGDATSACLCEASGTYTASAAGDCDDSSSAVSPEAVEDELNGVDDDCDGTVDEAGIEWPVDDSYDIRDIATYAQLGSSSSYEFYQRGLAEGGEDWDGDGYGEFVVATWAGGSAYVKEATGTSASLTSIASISGSITSAAVVDDQDGDGEKELLLGAYTASTYGRVYLLHDEDIGTSASVTTLADTTLTAASPVQYFGYTVGNVGDLYGDGVGDLLVSAPYTSSQRVYVYDGPVAAGSVSTSSAAVTFSHATSGVGFGYAAESDGDLDGDGVPDVVVGAYAESSSAGKVYVFDGASASGSIASTAAEAVLSGESSSDYAGFQLDVADDLNADGYDDLIVGAENAGSYGRAYVFLGPVSTGSVTTADLTLDGDGGNTTNFGYTVQAVGDLDDDGVQDIAVGGTSDYGTYYFFGWDGGAGSLYPEDAFASFTETNSLYRAGAAIGPVGDLDADGYDDLVLAGAYTGTTSYRAYVLHANFRRVMASGATSEVIDTTGSFTTSVANAGDFNADGFSDMLVGSMYTGSAGSGLLYFGPFAGDEYSTADDGTFTGSASNDDIGVSVAGAADFDGDAYDDVVVGGPFVDTIGANAGAVHVFAGAATGYDASVASAAATMYGAATGDYFGWSVATVPDLDADGWSELLVGAPYHDSPGTDAGRVYFYSAPFSTTGESATTTLTAESAGDYLGYSVNGGGDVDGDGFVDLLLGAPYDDDVATDAGAAYLFTSAPVGTVAVSSADTKLRGEARQDYAGTSVAILGDADGDGYDDLAVGAPGSDEGATSGGQVYVILGPPATGNLSLSSADWSVTGESTSVLMGTEVAAAGDLNGDGRADLLFSGSLVQDYSRVGVVHGPFDGRLPFYFYYWDDAYMRRGISGIGDQDGDGLDDFAITGTYEESWGRVYMQKGR